MFTTKGEIQIKEQNYGDMPGKLAIVELVHKYELEVVNTDHVKWENNESTVIVQFPANTDTYTAAMVMRDISMLKADEIEVVKTHGRIIIRIFWN